MTRSLNKVHSIDDLRLLSARKLPRMVRDFVDGGAGREVTLAANRSDFDEVWFRPRSLVDVSKRDQSIDVFGEELSLPVALAPAGLARLVDREGELAAARAAGKAGTIFAVSTASSCSIEDIAAVATGPLWFQLYLWKDRQVVSSLLDRADAAGYQALCLTVDVPIVGKRVRDLHNGMTIPPKVSPRNAIDAAVRLHWMRDLILGKRITFANFIGMADGDDATSLGTYVNQELINPSANWDDMTWLRSRWSGPIVVKGILTGDDATNAVQLGADGIIVSNHGGRQLDGSPSAIRALPEVVAAVGDDVPVYLDGGIRTGGDVVRAKALGAQAVFVGRPWFWGLAAAGEAGVSHMLEILRTEIDTTMALIGRPTFADIGSDAVV